MFVGYEGNQRTHSTQCLQVLCVLIDMYILHLSFTEKGKKILLNCKPSPLQSLHVRIFCLSLKMQNIIVKRRGSKELKEKH